MKCKDCNEEGCPYRAYTDNAECLYTPCREIEETSFDWQSFRAEAAKDIISNALIPYALKEFSEESINIDYWTDKAIEWTDALVKKLKEKEEK